MRSELGEVIAIGQPGGVLDVAVRPGDRLVRSSPAEGVAYSAVVLSNSVESAADLIARGISVERAGAGGYVEVLELGDHRGAGRPVGRRLTDGSGRVPSGQALLRAGHGVRPGRTYEDLARELVEQPAQLNVCQARQAIAAAARAEEARWTGPNGVKLLEGNPIQAPTLTQYWSAVPQFAGNAAAVAAQVQLSANDLGDGEWSAAFICFVMQRAGVQAAHGFDFGPRHLNYIVGALRNRERADRNRPFWLVDHLELEHEASPEPGDLVCFNRCRRQANLQDPGCPPNHVWTRHTYQSLRQRFWLGGNQNAQVVGSSHCSLVVGTTQQGGQLRLELIGGNEGNSVRVRTHIALDADGHILNPVARHIFGMIKLIGC
jgi:hypothetical protein